MENNVLVFPDDKYDELKSVLENNGNNVDDIAFFVFTNDWSYIIIRESFVEENDQEVINIVLAHEMAHASGILDEEEADRKALESLNGVEQNILIEAWEDRHGKKYEI